MNREDNLDLDPNASKKKGENDSNKLLFEQVLKDYKTGNVPISEIKQKLLTIKNQMLKMPLSEGQKGLWTLHEMAPDSSAYTLPICFRLCIQVDVEKLKQALQFVRESYPILKTEIQSEQGVPFQAIHLAQPLMFHQEDISHLNEEQTMIFLKTKGKHPFEIEQSPLMRAHLFSKGEQEHFLLVTIHHIIFDGVSMVTFASTLFQAYNNLLLNRQLQLKSSAEHYGDFVEWEQNLLKGSEGKKHLDYWKQKLSDLPSTLMLPTDLPRSPLQTFKGETHSQRLPAQLSTSVKALASSEKVNVSVVFLAIFNVLLHRYTSQNDILVGVPTIGRPETRFASLIGYFINMVAIRSQGFDGQSFSEFLQNVQKTLGEALDHASYPFPKLVKELRLERTKAHAPLFQVAFIYQNFFQAVDQGQQDLLQSLGVELIEEIRQEGEFELSLEVYEKEGQQILNLHYNPDLYHATTIQRMMGHYLKLIEETSSGPSLQLSKYSLLSSDERNELLFAWNATEADFSKHTCIHTLFEEKALQTPDAIAVVFDKEILTFQQLDEKSSDLALYLQKQGVSPETLVGICVDRSLEMIVGILGILKAGGAYVPLSPHFPDHQLKQVIEDSQINLIVTQACFKKKWKGEQFHVVVLDQEWNHIIHAIDRNICLERVVEPHHLAYVLYTSGSTGKPKGVMVEHRNVMNTLLFLQTHFPVAKGDAYLLKTNYIFDVSLSELFCWFIGEGHLVILPQDEEKSPSQLKDCIEKHRVTHVNFIPALLNAFLDGTEKGNAKLDCLKYVMVAGEAFPKELVKKALAFFKNSRVENIYGPTETSIYAAWFHCNGEIEAKKQTPIGKPISNTQIYIVDHILQPVPVGVPGELCVAGNGLARGYWNAPELTRQKFIDNPFKPGSKLYKTGDLARWLPDGQIEYLGRLDQQVKIRGFRIELGAIESLIGAHPEVREAVIIVKQKNDHKKLVAYYVASDENSPLSSQELRKHIQTHLPDYMVPAHVIQLSQIPLTSTGKIDRKKLEQREIDLGQEEVDDMPQSDIEKKILAIWQDLLHVQNISIDAGFFDVGGDSLLAISVVKRIKQELSYVISTTDLFTYPNIRSLSAHLSKSSPKRGMVTRNKEHSSDLPAYYQESVAIVGISCQFPGSKNLREFWQQIKDGKECVTFFTKEELDALGISKRLIDNPNYVPVNASLDNKDMFDPEFFHLSPKDAELMDPQLRLLLTHAWKAVEDAGYVPKKIPDTSVYMSASNNCYQSLLFQENTEVLENSDGYVAWVLSQSGTIPTMISHKLGLKGPSYFVHSNCSSSLIGLYAAFQSIRSGESTYALIGGTTLHVLSKIGYVHQPGLNFSSDGHVKAFDASADGMIPGEGVAVILVKNAAKAIEDGDHIYAILRGIGTSNDGAEKAGFYAPSVKGQASVIKQVFNTTGIHPESVNYIEAHGTGTKLGDPIELAALRDAFAEFTDKTQFCGIGSVKTNLGHLDTAAGLAGCIKVALSLCHSELVPSLHYKKPNPEFDLLNSPFYIVDKRIALEKGRLHRAAVSSFGIGGTNVHALFEQFLQITQKEKPSAPPYFIPISARNEERLRVYIQELLDFLRTPDWDERFLMHLAYTFQVGREAMKSRILFISQSTSGLLRQMKDVLAGKTRIEGCYRIGEESPLISDEKAEKCVHMWLTGEEVNWDLLYPEEKPQKMSLPTYPFAQKRFWPEMLKKELPNALPQLHPMVHRNTSTLARQRFTSTFTGKEYFIEEHVIQDKTIIPGVVILEMARAAVEKATENLKSMIRLKHVVWVRPIVVDEQPVEIQINLFPEEKGQIFFKMQHEPAEDETEPVLYNQGLAELKETAEETYIDLEAIRRQCDQEKMGSEQFYDGMIGTNYGPHYRVVREVFFGRQELLARIVLPNEAAHTKGFYILHPSLMDGALQVAEYLQNLSRLASLSDEWKPFQAALPFALEEMDVIRPCVPEMWAHVTFSKGDQENEAIRKVDIELSDGQGTVCVRIRGFSIRVMESAKETVSELHSSMETLIFEPKWEQKEIIQESSASDPEYARHMVMLCERENPFKAGQKQVEVSLMDLRTASIDNRFRHYAKLVFEKIQEVLRRHPSNPILLQIVISTEQEHPLFSGILGLLKTARLENSKLIGQIIEIEPQDDSEMIIAKLKENKTKPSDQHIRYVDGKRYVMGWNQVISSQEKRKIPWQKGKVYLITGGAGGLGLMFAHELVEQAKECVLILIGRSSLEKGLEGRLAQMGNVIYKQVDVADREAVQKLIEMIQREYGTLNGIIHAAGVLKDSYILNKTVEEIDAVLAPKVTGLVNLDIATKDIALDFFILFSSVSGSLGSAGQADYALANAFMDAYADYRHGLVATKQRYGKTFSINWPLWKEGGMHVEAQTEQMLKQRMGMAPMETTSGIEALYQGWGLNSNHIMVVAGEPESIKQKIFQPLSLPIFFSPTVIDDSRLLDKVKDSLKQELGKKLKIGSRDIDDLTEMSKYGFDSISMIEFVNHLNQKYTLELLPTLFFEYPTLHAFATYIVNSYRDTLASHFNVGNPIEKLEQKRFSTPQKSYFQQPVQSISLKEEPIAIVGMSGVFPMAEDIDAFWKNLEKGQDCISEIPSDRWDWQAYYGDPAKEINKTNVKWGGFLDSIAEFDPLFFGISPREAELMDPQQRLLLTYVWKAIEDAGCAPRNLSGTKTGVFIGTGNTGYSALVAQSNPVIEGSSAANMSPSAGPNRVSYLLDLHGPSESIDTACSSSLVAIHHAMCAIQEGSCEMAIAGGINTIILPEVYITFDKAGALSKEGKCKAFSNRADGFAHGEGVGILFLKKLSAAELEGDQIYGVIRSAAVNHGGHAASLTTPNSKAQADLLISAYKKADIDPQTITYIEAHGTGTELGDPIEINGLKAALKQLYTHYKNSEMAVGHCGLGSVKTNIGHLSLAAGVAGVIKVLLQLKHKMLVKSLHSDTLNPYIQLKESPFYIVQENQEWKSLKDANGRPIPRRAGISSFGIGGVNAHVVVEEYIPKGHNNESLTTLPSHQNPIIIILSAKKEEQLKELSQQLLKAVQQKGYRPDDLAAIAYTLQVGRDAMEERLALLVTSLQELEEKLTQFLAGQEVLDLYRGKVEKGTLQSLIDDEEMQETIGKWMLRAKYRKLLELWVRGLSVDWSALYQENRPKKISLPTYPFSQEHYWVEKKSPSNEQGHIHSFLHPLLQQNTSDLSQQRFSSTFTGQEFFLQDHVIRGKRVLPGVAHLEIAREALELALDSHNFSNHVVKLKNIVWLRPIILEDQPVRIHIKLYPVEQGSIAFEIYDQQQEEDDSLLIYSQGNGLLISEAKRPKIDLSLLQAACHSHNLLADEVYHTFKKIGFDYGPAFSGLKTISIGENLVIAKLSLPPTILNQKSPYVLHPGIMDSALQASSLLVGAQEDQLMLPFSVEEIEIYSKCTAEMWVCAQISEENHSQKTIQKRNLDLCDADGTVCIRIKGISFRIAYKEKNEESPKSNEIALFEPIWNLQDVGLQTVECNQRLIVLCDRPPIPQQIRESLFPGVEVICLDKNPATLENRFHSYATQIFEKIQDLFRKGLQKEVLFQVVIPARGEQRVLSGLAGLLKTARLENTKLIGQLIEIDSSETVHSIAEKLHENCRSLEDKHIRYQEDRRYVAEWKEVKLSSDALQIPWKKGGIYLITGGAGGLGSLFAKEIVSQQKHVVLILTGRSLLKEDQKRQLTELEESGAQIIYKQIDVTDKNAVLKLVKTIQQEHGDLSGVLHAAGILNDKYILNKTTREFQEVISPKVMGLVNLDHATQDIQLDFFVLFSSGSGSLGSAGQIDYSTANAFMDAYAAYRNELVHAAHRHGHTLSINWPLWKEGGMRVDVQTEKMLQQNAGIVPLETKIGMQVFYQIMELGKDKVLVLQGAIQKIKQKLFQTLPFSSSKSNSVEIGYEGLTEKVQQALTRDISKILKIKLKDIDIDKEFSQYGFDSITLTEFANQLNTSYKLGLAPTIFFEYPILRDFASYLVRDYQGVLASQFAVHASDLDSPQNVADETNAPLQSLKSRFLFSASPLANKRAQNQEPIAIIGISGVFPMAKDVGEFWHNLEKEKNCITEIPKDRWDWKAYYGDPAKEANKTDVKWGGFLDTVANFDPLFFGISPREAVLMDPQQRLLMTYVWKALEDAGYTSESISGTKTGVFIGTGNTGYSSLIAKARIDIEGTTAANMSPSIGPNRVNYFLNLHGPSEPIDTACSSSLVAVHHAVCAIQEGSCDMAFAGGVNTVVTPEGHIAYDKAGALSKEGICKTFSDKADGFAVGEGVGILLLKKLSSAEQDGDQIYGVIRSTAVNHGGHANSLTTPNPKAQADLLISAYRKAEIDPRTVTYIEAHGTGTVLGDPVEINGLKAAFTTLSQEFKGSEEIDSRCGIGSVKTNIGHLSLAAGVAGIIKVLLQLKHKTIVKSLHSETINPYIHLSETPFYIVQEKQEWKVINDKHGRPFPRRAGISSFGIGGVNAHVVIEEFIPKKIEAIPVTSKNPALILLSAKKVEQLKAQALQLLEAIQQKKYKPDDLAAIAYTLQIGRNAMQERLALIVTSLEELEEKLSRFIEGQEAIADTYSGTIDRGTLHILTADEEIQDAISKWIERRKYPKLLELWVKGLHVDWKMLYQKTSTPQKISLPTYPFARESYWVEEKNSPIEGEQKKTFLHPLLHQNTSDFSQQRFSSTFTGKEFFLADHCVQGKQVLPGVCYLEMAREATLQAICGLEKNQAKICIRNIVWIQPIVIDSQSTRVDIALSVQANNDISYEIYCNSGENKSIHSQGHISIYAQEEEVPTLDLKTLSDRCNQKTLSSWDCYELFQMMGIDYGPSHQGIETLYVGRGEALAKLSLPHSVLDTIDSFVLHPSLMDAALQASIGVRLGSDTQQLSLPFALEEIEIFDSCISQMWVYVKQREQAQELDIDLCNELGEVCVRFKRISSRVVEEKNKTLMLAPQWDPIPIQKCLKSQNIDNRTIIIGSHRAIEESYPAAQRVALEADDTIEEIAKKLEAYGSLNHIVWIAAETEGEIINDQYRGVIQLYRLIKALLLLKYENQEISWSIFTEQTQSVYRQDRVNPTHASVHGLIGSMKKEFSNWNVRLVDLEENHECPISEIFSLPFNAEGNAYAYRHQQWHQLKLIPIRSTTPTYSAYRRGGVYVVIGGAGGIGEVWSEYLIQTYQAQVVWIGRRKKNAVIEEKIERLATLGPKPLYIEADAANEKDLKRAYEEIKQTYPQIHGVIHSAIVLQDRSLMNMHEMCFKEVLKAKVDVSVCLAQVFQKEPLDFVLFFSSMQSFAKASGQSNYASGCTFKDAFAHKLSREWPCVVKVMNWGYWGNVGVVASPHYQERMAKNGVGSIEPPEAMEALEWLLVSPLDQIVLLQILSSKLSKRSGEDEFIDIYPDEIPSHLEKLQEYELSLNEN